MAIHRKLVRIGTVALTCLSLTACLPVLVGGLIYKSSKSQEQKQEFMTWLHQTNAQREANGLKPLDWCTEAARFDRGWAYQDAACRARIDAVDKGQSEVV